MTTFRSYTCTVQQAKACAYLERRGLLFGGTFGFRNAIEIAKSVRAARRGNEDELAWLGSIGIHLRPAKEAGK